MVNKFSLEYDKGRFRKWLHFDGVDDFVREINATTPEQFTLIVFGEDKSTEDWALVFGNPECDPDCSYRSLVVFSHFATENYYQIGFGATDGYWRSANFYPGKNGQFKKFLIVTFDGTNLSVNIDDRYKASSSLPYTPRPQPIKYIGGKPSEKFFQGNIYFVALYNRALSDEEIKKLYLYVKYGVGKMITDALVLWLDGSSIDIENQVWKDKSGNGNDGTIYGATLQSGWVEG